MKTPLQKQLAAIAPSILIQTAWGLDEDAPPHREGTTWQAEISASAIVYGELITSNSCLGDIREKAGADPWKANPDVSGYERDMTADALEGLLLSALRAVGEATPANLQSEIQAAVDFLAP